MMIINDSESYSEHHTDIYLPEEYPNHYISGTNFKSNSKHKYLSYINDIGLNDHYDIYCVKYWIYKEE